VKPTMLAVAGTPPTPTDALDCNRSATESGSGELHLHAVRRGMKEPVFHIGVTALCLLYVIVLANTPISVLPIAGHDDGYYMRFGRLIAEGHWLGPYDQYTLMKGPGYPLFLALANWLGLSVTLAQALFHCTAVIFFATVCRRLMGSYLATAVLVVLLLWEPIYYTTWHLRVLRDGFYADQVLIVLGGLVWTFFGASTAKEQFLYAGFSGAMFGWFWLTREDSLWAVPGFLLLALAALVGAAGQQRRRRVLLSICMVAAAWGTVVACYRTVNLIAYNSFAGVETGERNYQRALSALHSVRSGGTKPFVSVTREARQRIYPFSPTFATLAAVIDGDLGKGWEFNSCAAMPASCGEIGSGWFAFMLRDAVAASGNYSSPAQASAFYGRMADEITEACAKGALECRPQLITEIPNVSWSQVRQIPEKLWRAVMYILHPKKMLFAGPSAGQEELFATYLQFLNNPLHTKSTDIPIRFTVRGWYRKSGSEWFSAAIKSPKTGEGLGLARIESPDLVKHFGDPDAALQRFVANITCFQDCALRLSTLDGIFVDMSLSEIVNFRGPIDLGGGTFFIDLATGPLKTTPPVQVIATAIRSMVMDAYEVVGVAVFIAGVVAFLATASLSWRQAVGNVCFIIAFISWTLAGSRVLLLVVLDAMTMPVLHVSYLPPANLLVWSAAVLSCTAAFQCISPNQR
jgi:hypothetical protein